MRNREGNVSHQCAAYSTNAAGKKVYVYIAGYGVQRTQLHSTVHHRQSGPDAREGALNGKKMYILHSAKVCVGSILFVECYSNTR